MKGVIVGALLIVIVCVSVLFVYTIGVVKPTCETLGFPFITVILMIFISLLGGAAYWVACGLAIVCEAYSDTSPEEREKIKRTVSDGLEILKKFAEVLRESHKK